MCLARSLDQALDHKVVDASTKPNIEFLQSGNALCDTTQRIRVGVLPAINVDLDERCTRVLEQRVEGST